MDAFDLLFDDEAIEQQYGISATDNVKLDS